MRLFKSGALAALGLNRSSFNRQLRRGKYGAPVHKAATRGDHQLLTYCQLLGASAHQAAKDGGYGEAVATALGRTIAALDDSDVRAAMAEGRTAFLCVGGQVCPRPCFPASITDNAELQEQLKFARGHGLRLEVCGVDLAAAYEKLEQLCMDA